MKATRSNDFFRLGVLSCFFLLLSAFTRAAHKMSISPSHLGVLPTEQNRRSRHTKQRNSNSNTLPEKQAEDQSLLFMWSLYRKAADLDGRPKQHKLFGSNTVRLIRASATRKQFHASLYDLLYTYTVEYELENLPLDKVMRASFVHMRSPVALYPPVMCEARVSSSQHASHTDVVTLGPQSLWTESDVTSYVSQFKGSQFILFIQYKCLKPGQFQSSVRHRAQMKRFPPQNHLRAPALLLFLEEEGQPVEWAKHAKAPSHSGTRFRRSREPGSIVSDIPNYKRDKNSVAKNQCKLHSYRVTFRDLGWDHWIIAPHIELGVADVPLPSCVPYKYKPISVLMMEKNGSIVYKEYEDMIAESCTCR
uniref:TGF-beta family profile domain-containing protein n=1 Tax=Electrophorus electricus TaxID=8005 RepID=A0A4W4DM28_ELEEL